MELPELGELLGRMAVDAINVQALFNRDYEIAIQRLLEMERLPDSAASWLRPAALRLSEFTLEFRMGVSVSREQEFAIRAIPINSEYVIRTNLRTDRLSRLSFSVQQFPINQENRYGQRQ